MHTRLQTIGLRLARIAGGRPARSAALAAGLLATVTLCGCRLLATGVGNSKDFAYCTILPDAPASSHARIIGPAHFRCDGGGADSITLTVTLQRLDSHGQWQAAATATSVTHGRDTSRAVSESARVRSVSAPCATGKFRTLIHAVEDSRGLSRTIDDRSPTVPNPCNL